jgi:hypothetical protein
MMGDMGDLFFGGLALGAGATTAVSRLQVPEHRFSLQRANCSNLAVRLTTPL